MTSNFKKNVGCILKGKENWDIWFVGLRIAGRFENLWRNHLNTSPTLPIENEKLAICQIDVDKIRTGILLVTKFHLHNLINETKHDTAWKFLEEFKKHFDPKSNLEFVNLVLKMKNMQMTKGRASEIINLLRPIKQVIEKYFRYQCITWAFLVQFCLHVPDYKNLLASLSANGTLKTLTFEALFDKLIELDKTFETHFEGTSDNGFTITKEDAYYSKGQANNQGHGRDRGTHYRGRGKGRQQQQQEPPSQHDEKPQNSG